MGGSRPGEMYVYLAPPGHGKSQWLTHASRVAWTRNRNVIYFSFEMAEPRILQRFYAPIVKTPVTEIPFMKPDVFTRRVQRYQKVNGVDARFVVKRYPDSGANVHDLTAVLDHFEERGVVFDLVVVDYADSVAPLKRTGNRRDDTNAVYKELRNLAVTRNVRLWTASQTNRLALRKKIITIEHLSEDFSKAMTADYIIAQAQTDAEKEVGEARLYMAKCRNNGQGEQILVNTDFAYARFVENTTGSRVGEDAEGGGGE
jgi:replicative DNA helicase